MYKKIIFTFLACSILFVQTAFSADIKQMATDKVQNKITETKSNIANKATTFVKDTIQEYVPNTEVSITGMEDAKPQWEIITVQPIRDIGDDLTFFQGSLLRWDGDRDTINLGLGQRRFLMDKTIMIGANAFYDHEFDVDHSRLGFGTELISSVGELRANRYYANSNSRKNLNRAGLTETAMDGFDYEAGTHVPYIPAWKMFVKYFSWDRPNTSADQEGFTYSTEFKTPYGFTLAAGLTKYDNSKDDEPFVKVIFNTSAIKEDSKIMQEIAYELKSVEDKKFTKVRRENRILTNRFRITMTSTNTGDLT